MPRKNKRRNNRFVRAGFTKQTFICAKSFVANNTTTFSGKEFNIPVDRTVVVVSVSVQIVAQETDRAFPVMHFSLSDADETVVSRPYVIGPNVRNLSLSFPNPTNPQFLADFKSVVQFDGHGNGSVTALCTLTLWVGQPNIPPMVYVDET